MVAFEHAALHVHAQTQSHTVVRISNLLFTIVVLIFVVAKTVYSWQFFLIACSYIYSILDIGLLLYASSMEEVQITHYDLSCLSLGISTFS